MCSRRPRRRRRPAGPLPDPFGNQAVDLTPKSPPPPEPAVVEAAPAPPEPTVAPAAAVAPAALEVRVHAYFCTDKSELTPASAQALDKEIAAWGDRITGKDLVVAGYADTRGVAVYNTWLGGERAKAVVNYLTAQGLQGDGAGGRRAAGSGRQPELRQPAARRHTPVGRAPGNAEPVVCASAGARRAGVRGRTAQAAR